MSVESVRAYLAEKGYGDRVLEFSESSATVALAAQRLGCEEAHIAKTLSFETPEGCVLIVAAGDAKVDNAKYKGMFHTKAKMVPADQLEEKVGHPAGGVCPFALKEGVRVYLDESLRRFDTIYPAAGSAASAVRLSCEELAAGADGQPQWVDLCKGWGDAAAR